MSNSENFFINSVHPIFIIGSYLMSNTYVVILITHYCNYVVSKFCIYTRFRAEIRDFRRSKRTTMSFVVCKTCNDFYLFEKEKTPSISRKVVPSMK